MRHLSLCKALGCLRQVVRVDLFPMGTDKHPALGIVGVLYHCLDPLGICRAFCLEQTALGQSLSLRSASLYYFGHGELGLL